MRGAWGFIAALLATAGMVAALVGIWTLSSALFSTAMVFKCVEVHFLLKDRP